MFLPKFFGKVNNGKVEFEKEFEFRMYLQKFEGREIEFVLGPIKRGRTNPQNNWYWGVLVAMIADEMGVLPDQAHEMLKWKFLKVGVEYKGKRYEVAKSSANLSTKEFGDFCDRIRDWASQELNLYIPAPDEVILEI